MTDVPYVARFASAAGDFHAFACQWGAGSGSLLCAAELRAFEQSEGVDIGLRFRQDAPEVTVVASSDRTEKLMALQQRLTLDRAGRSLRLATSAQEFDQMVSLPSAAGQIRLNHEGYLSDGRPLACDFRLYPSWLTRARGFAVDYHLCLRRLTYDPERTRAARKFLATLAIEQPYSAPVRELQALLAQRLLKGGWLADEYLLFRDPADLRVMTDAIQRYFAASGGTLGFQDPPFETGDFGDWLTTGCHWARDPGLPESVPILGAHTFLDSELAYLAQQSGAVRAAAVTGKCPVIFISYASHDFALADATRDFLETEGWPCWIAPRDINSSSLSYAEAIPLAINQVLAVVVLLSSPANLSVHIPRELDLALARRLPVIPLRLENVAPEGQLGYFVRTCQWLDMFGRDFSGAMAELRSRLRMIIP